MERRGSSRIRNCHLEAPELRQVTVPFPARVVCNILLPGGNHADAVLLDDVDHIGIVPVSVLVHHNVAHAVGVILGGTLVLPSSLQVLKVKCC